MNTFTVQPGGTLSGAARVPGDKSISHRSIMLGALAEGETRVSGFLEGADCLATLEAFRAMGVPIERKGPGEVVIQGRGLQGLRAPDRPLDMGNSGTAMRLLCGVLAGQSFDSELIGDESLTRRPMRRVTEPLARMGAQIETSEAGTPPLRIRGGAPLRVPIMCWRSPAHRSSPRSCWRVSGQKDRPASRNPRPLGITLSAC